MDFNFRQFVERYGPSHRHKHKPKKANYIDSIWQELGIDRDSLPDFIESGPIKVEDEGITYNQAIWQIIKPIEEDDMYVRIKFYKSKSPNFERAYVTQEDGQLKPYMGKLEGKIHLISIQKLSEILGKGWQSAIQQGGMG